MTHGKVGDATWHHKSVTLGKKKKEWLTISHVWEMNSMAYIEPCGDDVIKRI